MHCAIITMGRGESCDSRAGLRWTDVGNLAQATDEDETAVAAT